MLNDEGSGPGGVDALCVCPEIGTGVWRISGNERNESEKISVKLGFCCWYSSSEMEDISMKSRRFGIQW